MIVENGSNYLHMTRFLISRGMLEVQLRGSCESDERWSVNCR